MGSTISASDNDPLALRYRVLRRQPRVWEVGLNLTQRYPNASTPDFAAVVLAVLGEAACGSVEVSAIERITELFGDAPIGLGNVQGLRISGRMVFGVPILADSERA